MTRRRWPTSGSRIHLVRFDLFHVLTNPDRTRTWTEMLDETRRRVELADELGFDGIWFGEHHFDVAGGDVCPNPVMLAADMAGRTTNIRLGMSAVTLTVWHPIRLAEDLAMLDHFSGGRMDVAFSRGILRGEIINIDPAADRTNEEQSRAIFAENLEIVKGAWTSDPFSWKGERYQIPQPESKLPGEAFKPYQDENGHLTGLVVLPQPIQQPMPPLYAVSQATEGFRLAAHQGLGVITSHPTGRKLQGLNDAYREEADKVGYPPHVGRMCAVVRDFCIADTDEEARRISEPFIQNRFDLIRGVRGIGAWLDTGEDPDDPKLQGMSGFDVMMERDYLLIGAPDSVAKRMVRIGEELGIDHWLLSMGRMTDEEAERSMHLMAEEVLPAVRPASAATSS
jgi:alkanesulfonate monooxygenase SsuD/methylene tetrahydromethanopterin reductase-like flavin-dependent oxidoreductase (luciferase family)